MDKEPSEYRGCSGWEGVRRERRGCIEICSFTLILVLLMMTWLTPIASGERRSSTHCRSQGGSCEPMLGCLLTSGIFSGSCPGIFMVCCAQTTAALSRWINTNNKAVNNEDRARSMAHHALRSTELVKSIGKTSKLKRGRVINDPECGIHVSSLISPIAHKRVLDGRPAGFGRFPWQALVRVGKGKCGGVLINRRHVVTAGHCVKNKKLSSVSVVLGEYHLKQEAEPYPSRSFRVSRAVVHPNFKFAPAADRFDVAVLTLAQSTQYAPHIAPICLPEAGRDPEPGTTAYVAGWGALVPDDVSGPLIQLLVPEIKRPSVLQYVNLPVIDNKRCEAWHRASGIEVTIWPEMVCAGYRGGGKDACKGDSGGPLMVQQADGRWVLVGLVSAGFSCGKPGQPGIYHRISATSDWITYHAYGKPRIRG